MQDPNGARHLYATNQIYANQMGARDMYYMNNRANVIKNLIENDDNVKN